MLISIITPVYKVEEYLHRCIDSILDQTYSNFELLLIDDGSPDNCGRICDEYAAKDSRIRVFHKENGGVSSARNLGVDNSLGDYLCFIDSDDWVEPTYLSNFNIDIYYADFYISGFSVDKNNKTTLLKKYDDVFVNTLETICSAYLDQGIWKEGFPWGKLYKREIIFENKIRFNEKINYGEDLLLIFDFFKFISSLCTSSQCCYHYTSAVEGDNRVQLSTKVRSYEENVLSSNLDRNRIDFLVSRFCMSTSDMSNLYNLYVYSRRLSAIWSLMIREDVKNIRYNLYCIEFQYWRNQILSDKILVVNFIRTNKLKMFILLKVKPKWLSYFIFYICFKYKKLLKNI